MHPACQLCRGACCESLVLNLPPTDSGTWLALHGTPISAPLGGGTHEIEARCRKLSACGRCTIHAARPRHCHDYAVGGADCRATVARRRPRQSAAILALLDRGPTKAAA